MVKQLSKNVTNRIRKIFIEETLDKIVTVRSKITACDNERDCLDSLKEIYIIFHSLKGTGKTVGFGEITEIAALALDTTRKAMDDEISLKLFKAKTEASLCEIEETLPQKITETDHEKMNTETNQGTVLVVDDDISLVQAIKERLSIEGFKVLVATSFKETAAQLELRIPIDLMIFDIVMPEGSGFELCQTIRKEQNYDDTPIIFLTAETSMDLKMKGFEIGADDYVLKPISLEELAARVRATVNRTKRYKNRLLHDELTGAYNRSFLKVKFDEEKARSQRSGKTFGLCLLDLDCFKNVNDKYGHVIGDKVLVEFVNFFKQRTRPSDAVIRFGGEEFILILSQIKLNKIAEILDRLRDIFSKQVFEANKEAFSITFSAGIAVYPEDGKSLEELLVAADKALYGAKHSGRDKVCFLKGEENI